ncbi:unnamed protein product, partial [Didymodactylos carnosus]
QKFFVPILYLILVLCTTITIQYRQVSFNGWFGTNDDNSHLELLGFTCSEENSNGQIYAIFNGSLLENNSFIGVINSTIEYMNNCKTTMEKLYGKERMIISWFKISRTFDHETIKYSGILEQNDSLITINGIYRHQLDGYSYYVNITIEISTGQYNINTIFNDTIDIVDIDFVITPSQLSTYINKTFICQSNVSVNAMDINSLFNQDYENGVRDIENGETYKNVITKLNEIFGRTLSDNFISVLNDKIPYLQDFMLKLNSSSVNQIEEINF